jgi:surfeit locus 1 family protein
VAIVCVRLGFWQLDRLEQRRARNAAADAQLALPPLSVIDRDLLRIDSSAYRHVTARGRFDFEHEIVLLARSRRGVPGVHVVTPLLVDDSTAVLVERGWAPSPNGRDIDLGDYREPVDAAVEGVLLQPSANRRQKTVPPMWPLYVLTADPEPFATHYSYRLGPMLLRRTTASEQMPKGMRVVALPDMTEGSHLSYALQWFTFATIALVGSILLFRRTPARDRAAQEDLDLPQSPS